MTRAKAPDSWRMTPVSDLISCWFLATSALCIGLLANQLRDTPLPLSYQPKAERIASTVDTMRKGIQDLPQAESFAAEGNPEILDLEKFRTFALARTGVVIDARPEIFHRLGHVPGAIALPRDEFETYYQRHHALLATAQDQPLAIYCAGATCEDAELVGTALRRLGHTKIAIFRGGWDEWKRSGLPEELPQ